MPEDQFTEARLRDGTTLRLRGQLTPDQVAGKVHAYRYQRYQEATKPPESWGDPFSHTGNAGQFERSLGTAPAPETVGRTAEAMVRSGLPPEAPTGAGPRIGPNIYNRQGQVATRGTQMTGEPTVGDYLSTLVNLGTSPATETGGQTAPALTMDPRYLWDKNQRGGLSDVPELGTLGAQAGRQYVSGDLLGGGTSTIRIAGELASLGMGPGLVKGAVAPLAKGLAAGTVASQLASRGTQALGGSPKAQEFAGELGFWAPAGAGMLAGGLAPDQAPTRTAHVDSLTKDIAAKGGVQGTLLNGKPIDIAQQTAERMVDRYRTTGDARWINADNVTNPSVLKALGIQALQGTAALQQGAKGAALGTHHDQAPEVKPIDPQSTDIHRPSLGPEVSPRLSEAPWATPRVSPKDTAALTLTGAIPETKSEPVTSLTPPSRAVTESEGGFSLPKEGEVSSQYHDYKWAGADKKLALLKAESKLKYTQMKLRQAERSGDPAAIDSTQKQLVQDTLTWAKFANPDDIGFTLEALDKQAGKIGDQLAKMRDLALELRGGKASFYSAKDARQVSRNEFRKTTGVEFSRPPKEFVATLPQEIQDSLPLKGRERSEAINRLWAIQTIRDRAAVVGKAYGRVNEIAQAIADAKGSFPARRQTGRDIPATAGPEGVSATAEPITGPRQAPVPQETTTASAEAKLESFQQKARGEKPTETPVSPAVGREAPATAESKQPVQPIQAAEAVKGPGEPVRPAEGSEVRRPTYAERRAAQKAAQETLVAQQRVPPSEAEIGTTSNIFGLAQEDLRKSLGREPTSSEVLKRADQLKRQLQGPTTPEQDKAAAQLDERVAALEKKGMSHGTAVRMAKKQLMDIWQDEQGRLGMPGSVPHNPPPMAGPRAASPAWRLGNFLDRLSNLGADRTDQEVRARNVTREYASGLALDHLRLEAKLKEAIDRHEMDGEDEFRTFMDAGEGKVIQGPVDWSRVWSTKSPHPQAPFMNVEDVATAQELHSMFQDRWGAIQAILDKEPGGIENYLAHLWERPGMAKRGMAYFFGKRPIEGNKIFLKQRFYEYMSDGLDQGLKPITFNPIRMQLTALFQMDKFLAAHELKDMYKDQGLIKWSGGKSEVPAEWMPLHDKIFQPRKPQDGGMIQYGQWMAPPEVAKIFNRYVDPGLRGNPTYDAIRQYGNTLNQMNLGVSGYHFMFITNMASAADVGLGLEKIINNREYAAGVKSIARGSFPGLSAIQNYQLGKKIQAEAINPTGNPKLQAFVDDLVTAGARFEQDPMYRNTAGKQFLRQMKDGQIFQGLGTMAKTGVQNFPVTKFIMEKYVPRIKLGMAANMMQSRLGFLIDQGTTDPATIANELGKVWDSVDNRAGQMVYDNLFWNKALKDASFLAVRAVGWDYGSMREGLGAGKDVLQQLGKALQGQRPQITPRMSFVGGTVYTLALVGAVTTYFSTGHGPRTLEDYFYPDNGDGERRSLPSYMRDAYSISHDVTHLKADTAIHKLHPMWNQIAEFLQNKDYYNNEIRNEGDPAWQQAGQTAQWYGKSFIPFSATMAYERTKHGVSPWVAYPESFLGIQKAPSYVTQTPAEEMTLDFAKRHWQAGPLHSYEREQRDTYNLFRDQLSKGKLDDQALSNALMQGKLRPSDFDRLFDSNTRESPMLQEFKSGSIRLPDALKVMKVASPEERQALLPYLIDKMDQIDDYTVPEEQAYYLQQIEKYLQ